MKKIFTITFFVAVAMMAFVSCGGEGPDDPIDTDTVIVDDNEPVDNDVEPVDDTTDSEPTDDLTEETPDDDGLVDEEPTDDDQILADQKYPEKFAEAQTLVGNWISVNIEGYAITVTVTPREEDFTFALEWTQGFSGTQEWFGLELPLTYWEEESYLNFTLKKVGVNLVREDTGKNGELDKEFIFQKIQ